MRGPCACPGGGSSLSRHFCENGKMKERWKTVREGMDRGSMEKERGSGTRTASRNKEGKQRERVNEHPMRSSYQQSHKKGRSQWKLRKYYGKNGTSKSRDCSRCYMDIEELVGLDGGRHRRLRQCGAATHGRRHPAARMEPGQDGSCRTAARSGFSPMTRSR